MLAKLRYDPSNVDADGIFDGITGAGPWDSSDWKEATQVNGGAPDGLAHQLGVFCSADISTITLTLTGTDADNKPIVETVTGINNSTVETAKYFKTLTNVAASATLVANTVDIGWVDEFVGPTIPLNWRRSATTRMAIDVTGTISLDVEFALEDIDGAAEQSAIKWFVESASLDDETADSTVAVLIGAGYTGFRVRCNSYTDTAEFTLWAVQGENT
jgi:hypothetical protein